MQLIELLNSDLTFCDLESGSKKNLIEQIAKLVAQNIPSINAGELFDDLIAREKLGSTGVGEGVGIPHCRAEHCHHPIGVLVKLKEAIDFDAIDRQKVDLVFALLVPKESTDEHLQLLSQVAELFNQRSVRNALRNTSSSEQLYQVAKSILIEHTDN